MQLFFRGGERAPFEMGTDAEISVLVIKPGSIGDLLMATPMLNALRDGLPNAKLSLAVGTWSKVAVANNPDIDEVIDCGEIGTPRRYALGAYLAFAQRLRSRSFDIAFVADRSPMMTLLPFVAGVPVRVGLENRGRGFSLTNKVGVRKSSHESEIYLDLVRSVGLSVSDTTPRFHPTSDDLLAAERIFEEWGLSGGSVLIAAPGGGSNPGGHHHAKRWESACFAETADVLATHEGLKTVIVGQESDAEPARAMSTLMQEDAVNLVGQTSFGQLGALLRLASAYVGNDSAPSHLAAAAGIPTVTVFVDTDLRRFRPLGPESLAVAAGDARETIDAVVEGVIGLTAERGRSASQQHPDLRS
jgi:ADP-heptose:LPS heptosyltransferase